MSPLPPLYSPKYLQAESQSGKQAQVFSSFSQGSFSFASCCPMQSFHLFVSFYTCLLSLGSVLVCLGHCNKITPTGGLTTEMYFLEGLEAGSPQDQGLAGLVSSEASLLGLWMTVFFLRHDMVFPLVTRPNLL